ncbi:MAG: hypothetical protein J6125_04820, partial [Clostridia bacterium]|nr:hypothetical protein [Clostridia bacterium]
MKHIFIVNPAAGKRDATPVVSRAVEAVSGYDCELYRTTAPRDATRYVRLRCRESGEPMRFYACGGDGTINEVAEGTLGFPNASFSCYPCGSGNDFVKYYGGAERFFDLVSLFEAQDA